MSEPLKTPTSPREAFLTHLHRILHTPNDTPLWPFSSFGIHNKVCRIEGTDISPEELQFLLWYDASVYGKAEEKMATLDLFQTTMANSIQKLETEIAEKGRSRVLASSSIRDLLVTKYAMMKFPGKMLECGLVNTTEDTALNRGKEEPLPGELVVSETTKDQREVAESDKDCRMVFERVKLVWSNFDPNSRMLTPGVAEAFRIPHKVSTQRNDSILKRLDLNAWAKILVQRGLLGPELPLWRLSCYGDDFKPCSISGTDVSPEEARFLRWNDSKAKKEENIGILKMINWIVIKCFDDFCDKLRPDYVATSILKTDQPSISSFLVDKYHFMGAASISPKPVVMPSRYELFFGGKIEPPVPLSSSVISPSTLSETLIVNWNMHHAAMKLHVWGNPDIEKIVAADFVSNSTARIEFSSLKEPPVFRAQRKDDEKTSKIPCISTAHSDIADKAGRVIEKQDNAKLESFPPASALTCNRDPAGNLGGVGYMRRKEVHDEALRNLDENIPETMLSCRSRRTCFVDEVGVSHWRQVACPRRTLLGQKGDDAESSRDSFLASTSTRLGGFEGDVSGIKGHGEETVGSMLASTPSRSGGFEGNVSGNEENDEERVAPETIFGKLGKYLWRVLGGGDE